MSLTNAHNYKNHKKSKISVQAVAKK